MKKHSILLFNTLKHLKGKQIFYQVWYRINKSKLLSAYKEKGLYTTETLKFDDFLPAFPCADNQLGFTFLNLPVKFNSEVDWSYMENGKLWNYNLHYANYLLQENIPLNYRIELLKSLYKYHEVNNGLEPYPVSLRIINVIRLVCRHKIDDQEVLTNLRAEARFLSSRLEYHLLGNHLLENVFALLMAGAFFNNLSWINKASKVLIDQLGEQILKDGGHFELSPMYHQIIFYRMLELIDWHGNWHKRNEQNHQVFVSTAARMRSWLDNVTFLNGDIPLVNDSAKGITYTSAELFEYADRLHIDADENIKLTESGYRMLRKPGYECFVDLAKVGPDYQPGHAHADALSFILYVNKLPVLVERGTSTYQIGEQRSAERSTAAHNTLVFNDINQSEVWGGFRVGNRAKVHVQADSPEKVSAWHDGYQKFGCIHKRDFIFEDKLIVIKDEIFGKFIAANNKILYFHFHPKREVIINDDSLTVDSILKITFKGDFKIERATYLFAEEFNKYVKGVLIKVIIKDMLHTEIRLS